MATYKTWQEAPKTQEYYWVEYTDWTKTPEPSSDEKIIDLEKWETFPPINSSNKGAIWED